MVSLVRGYDELRLRIDRQTDGSHRIFVTTGSGEASAGFELPFSELELENFILRVSRPGRRLRRIPSSAVDDAKDFGGRLFRAAFHNQVRDLYRAALADARSRGYGLRITLCLSGSPDLVDVPWEFLFDDPDFLAVSALTPVVRYLDLPRGQRPLSVQPPLRVLAVVSSPADSEQLDVDLERENLEQALRSLTEAGAVELHWLERSTLTALLAALRGQEFHGLHYIGHGAYDHNAGQGTLVFEDDDGWARPVSGDQLGAVLHDFSSLRLAVLNACEGARAGLTDPFSGVAGSLVQRDIPAVVAMQFEISDQAAIAFAASFYEALATGTPVDASLAAARLSMLAARGDDVEWGTPVLFMRVPDGRIFDLPEDVAYVGAPVHERNGDSSDEGLAGTVSAGGSDASLTAESEAATRSATGARGAERATALERHGNVPDASRPRTTRHRSRWLVGLGTILAAATLGVVLLTEAGGSTRHGTSHSPVAPAPLSGHGPAIATPSSATAVTYTAEVHSLCRLVNTQANALPKSARRLKSQIAHATRWQQRQPLITQEVDSRINDAENLLTELDALEPPTEFEIGLRNRATTAIRRNRKLLNAYERTLENVRSEKQLARQVANFDLNHRPAYRQNAEHASAPLLAIGGPNCGRPIPNLPYIAIPGFHGTTDFNATPPLSSTTFGPGPRPNGALPGPSLPFTTKPK